MLVSAVVAASAKTIVITVGGNTTNDATTVFQPNVVVADKGDIVLFNFTNGNHTATQSTFAAPCTPIHDTDIAINGFDSSFRDAGKEQAITTLPVTIDNPNQTVWFYDFTTCAQGGVGAINLNKSSTETIDGFQRNAERLNGTTHTSSSAFSTATAITTATSTGSKPTTTNDATHISARGIIALALTFIALVISL
ncbi:hypothetical protein H2248_004597 [Termitomyces sp. 'cryptogamus']|nr:hypothetical protein H2248_004597 [Termitomyces sp. 'cryptogamus']